MAGIGKRKHEVNREGEVRDPSGDVQPKRIKMNKSDDWTTLESNELRIACTRLFRPLEELYGRSKMENDPWRSFYGTVVTLVTVGGRGSITVNGAVSRIAFEKSVANVHCARYAK